MEKKGRRHRKEVGPRERQDLTTNVEGQDQRKEHWKEQAYEESTFPRDGTGQRQQQPFSDPRTSSFSDSSQDFLHDFLDFLVRRLIRMFDVSRFLSPRSFSHQISSFQSNHWDGRRSRHSHDTENFNANTLYRHGNNHINQMCRGGQGEDACTFKAQLICC